MSQDSPCVIVEKSNDELFSSERNLIYSEREEKIDGYRERLPSSGFPLVAVIFRSLDESLWRVMYTSVIQQISGSFVRSSCY